LVSKRTANAIRNNLMRLPEITSAAVDINSRLVLIKTQLYLNSLLQRLSESGLRLELVKRPIDIQDPEKFRQALLGFRYYNNLKFTEHVIDAPELQGHRIQRATSLYEQSSVTPLSDGGLSVAEDGGPNVDPTYTDTLLSEGLVGHMADTRYAFLMNIPTLPEV